MNLRLFMPYPKQKARFEKICFKVISFSTGNKNNSRCKIVSRTLSLLNISHVGRTPAIPKC